MMLESVIESQRAQVPLPIQETVLRAYNKIQKMGHQLEISESEAIVIFYRILKKRVKKYERIGFVIAIFGALAFIFNNGDSSNVLWGIAIFIFGFLFRKIFSSRIYNVALDNALEAWGMPDEPSPKENAKQAKNETASFAGSSTDGAGFRFHPETNDRSPQQDDFAFDESALHKSAPSYHAAAQQLLPYLQKVDPHSDLDAEQFADGLKAMATEAAIRKVEEAINDPSLDPNYRSFLRRVLAFLRGEKPPHQIGHENRRRIAGG